MSGGSEGRRARWGYPILGVLLLCLLGLAVLHGETEPLPARDLGPALLAMLGFGEPVARQAVVEIRLWEALCAAGVGAALALSGGLLQGVFRNGLAAPGVIGVSAGSSLGASLAVLLLGGYAPAALAGLEGALGPVLVAAASFLGGLLVVALVVTLATSGGRVSVPTLLLAGIAVNACCSGLLALVQTVTMKDYDIARALFVWTFGSLDDKAPRDAALVWGAVLLGALVIPFVARELDLFAGGEDDARGLGVRADRVKALAVGAGALTAAVATAVAGQIVFLGLVVPHVVRLLLGRGHRVLLPGCLVGGAVFLLGSQVAQTMLLGDSALRPGVLMSLVGGPFFVFLLMRAKRDLRAW